MQPGFFRTFVIEKDGQFFSRAELRGGRSPSALCPDNPARQHGKMYNYIPLPSNMKDYSSVVELFIEEGSAGYGVYILVLQVLRDMPGYKVSNNAKRLAFTFHEKDIGLVDRVLHNYGLFDIDNNGLLFSPWLLQAMQEYDNQKIKRSEAGRRGAARRWASSAAVDGKAIALPSLDDGKAIAYNIMPSNITSDNITLPDLSNSRKVGEEFLEIMSKQQPPGHAPGYVAQVGLHYGMTEAAVNFICEQSNNAEITHPTYKAFCALVRRIQQEKWRPDHPDGFFLKKLFKKD